jgi:hypothetical protein
MVVSRGVVLMVGVALSFAFACGGQSVHEGEPRGAGGTGGAAGTDITHVGSGSWMGGTVNPGGGAPVDVKGINEGYAGIQCTDEDGGAGITRKGSVYFPESDLRGPLTDYCDSNGNLVEYYCDSGCAHGIRHRDGCLYNGGFDSLVVTCNGICLDGACAPPPE